MGYRQLSIIIMWNPFKRKISSEDAYKSNFYLAFTFIPMVVGLYNERKVEEKSLSDIKNWKGFIKSRLKSGMRFDWDNTYVSTTDVNYNPDIFIVLIRFAMPHTLATAKAGLIIGSRQKHHARFFTLECSFNGNMICECIGKDHTNHGITLKDGEDLTPFLMEVLKITDNKTDIEKNKQKHDGLQILYFYMKSKMTENQDALLREKPLILPVKKINLDDDEVLQTKYNIRVWPVFVLIDSKGNELHRWQGLSKGEKINNDLNDILSIR